MDISQIKFAAPKGYYGLAPIRVSNGAVTFHAEYTPENEKLIFDLAEDLDLDVLRVVNSAFRTSGGNRRPARPTRIAFVRGVLGRGGRSFDQGQVWIGDLKLCIDLTTDGYPQRILTRIAAEHGLTIEDSAAGAEGAASEKMGAVA